MTPEQIDKWITTAGEAHAAHHETLCFILYRWETGGHFLTWQSMEIAG